MRDQKIFTSMSTDDLIQLLSKTFRDQRDRKMPYDVAAKRAREIEQEIKRRYELDRQRQQARELERKRKRELEQERKSEPEAKLQEQELQ